MVRKREAFLIVFLAAFGAKRIEWSNSLDDKLLGTHAVLLLLFFVISSALNK